MGGQWTLLALVALIGLNLRPFLTAPGPILSSIEADTGLSYVGLSMLTLLPMLLMGAGAFIAPTIQAAVGTRRGMLIALAMLVSGSLLRSMAADGLFLILTAALCGAGAAFIQATLPGIIKEKFPASIPSVTGLYSAMIMGGGALGAHLAPMLLGYGDNWQAALAWLAFPAGIALVAASRTLSNTTLTQADRALTRTILRRRRTWTLMAAFGLVNGGYLSMVAWLAPYYQAQGWSVAESGSLVAIMAIVQAVSALAIPILAQRSVDRRPWLSVTLLLQAIGFCGLAFFPAASPIFWAAICGAGLGGSFSLSIVTALDHLPQPERAGTLTALMQGGGFLIAALAPLATAALHHWSGSFASGWLMHLGCVAMTFLLYTQLNPARYPEAMNLSESSDKVRLPNNQAHDRSILKFTERL